MSATSFLYQKDPDWHLRQELLMVLGPDGGELISLDGKTRFNVPAGALSVETTFTFTPQPGPNHAWGTLLFANNSFRLEAEDSLGNPVTVFDVCLNPRIASHKEFAG